jgi:cytochrome b561
MKLVSRYHPLLVTLHWALAVLIIAELSLGFFALAAMPSSDPQKIGILRVHMAGGVLILALMVIRFIVRMRTSRPADATRQAIRCWIGSRRSPTTAFTSWFS